MKSYQVWVVDFGSQYTQLITRKSRELGISSEIISVEESFRRINKGEHPKALVLSGGPQSIFEDKTDYSAYFKNSSLPILGICYGMQAMVQCLGGEVEEGSIGEYGHSNVSPFGESSLFSREYKAWMSHSDHVSRLPKDFHQVLESSNGLIAGIKHQNAPWLGLQFHPEVEHTEGGKDILKKFFFDVSKLETDWSSSQMLSEGLQYLNDKKAGHVLCAFSGGVDSLVAAVLAQKVYGDKLYCFFVDQGLLRPQDLIHIETLKKESGLNIETLDAKEYFYKRLKGIDDPEKKRKAIGNAFIEVFEEKVNEFEKEHKIHFTHLLQGTLYPDVIESISPHKKEGKSVTIKSHHNVGGLPERMKLKLSEPLRFLFKDEVRKLGEEMNLPESWLYRHPFPGPGIGIRVLGEVIPERVKQVQDSDQILFEELHNASLYDDIWQAFTVHLPVKTVGVKGDYRAYEEVICLRLVTSSDGMTAQWGHVPYEFLEKVSSRITNEVKGITRVVYDITSKPPGTIEWE